MEKKRVQHKVVLSSGQVLYITVEGDKILFVSHSQDLPDYLKQ